MSIKNIDNDGVMNLCNAIVEQAAKDYLKAKKGLYLKNPKNKSRIEKLQWRLEETTNFFRGKWYRTICTIDGEYMLQKLDEEFEEWKNDHDRKSESFDED